MKEDPMNIPDPEPKKTNYKIEDGIFIKENKE